MSEDLKQSVLFTLEESKKLTRRVKELQEEQIKIEKNKKTLERRKKYL